MQPLRRESRERDLGKPSKKKRENKVWNLEYQWISEKDFETYPKHWGPNKGSTYDKEWRHDGWFWRYSSPESAKDSLKKDLRSDFMARFIKGREWRVKNIKTGEIIDFPDIQNYYDVHI